MDSTKHSDKQNLRRASAAAYLRERYGLRCAATTLKKYASRGGGPRFHRVNRTALYPLAELDRWAAQKLGPLHGCAADRAPGDFDTTGAAAAALN
ncbi:hypothetical protein [Rhodopseudomonas palustris]|uniref:hypothetical protein n=1 Tax=Rhodopseudomonas palustris TaxID=1076 RepID=UPI0021F36472|nr:hypothetical protein [Rhodopseudomonas palustris]UYO55713.1 hypothetical protein KQX61_10050 [Rhodopseudomonas palustris]